MKRIRGESMGKERNSNAFHTPFRPTALSLLELRSGAAWLLVPGADDGYRCVDHTAISPIRGRAGKRALVTASASRASRRRLITWPTRLPDSRCGEA